MIRIDETTLIHAPIERCFDLSRSVEVHLLANVHSGEQAMALGGVTSGLVGLSQEVTWRAKHFGIWQSLTSRTTAMDAPRYFQVTMVRGIFRFMQADHLFRSIQPGTYRLAVEAPGFETAHKEGIKLDVNQNARVTREDAGRSSVSVPSRERVCTSRRW